MKEFKVFFGILCGVATVMCFTYYSRLTPVLLATLSGICLLSFLLALISYLKISVKTGDVPYAVWRKDEVTLDIYIRNNFILPLTPVRVYVKVCAKNKYIPENRMLIVSVPPMSGVTLRVSNVMSYRGEYKIGVEKVEIFDILKIFSFKKKWEAQWTPIAYPREIAVARIRDDNEDENENAIAKPQGLNKNAFSHLREYREGDTLRHIHWKLSARLDDLIVKQMEQNYNNAATVFCDFTWDFPTVEDALEASDTSIEVAQAIIRVIMNNGNRALFLYQDARTQKSEVVEVCDRESYEALKRSMIMLPAEPFSGSFTELFDEYSDEIGLERVVYIITPSINEPFIEKLRSLGLTLRTNVILVAVSPIYSKLIDYLEKETKVKVCCIDDEDVGLIGAYI